MIKKWGVRRGGRLVRTFYTLRGARRFNKLIHGSVVHKAKGFGKT